MSLYNIKVIPTGFTIAKFDDDCNFEVAYNISVDLCSCTCPAGPRPSCKHRKMVPRMVHQLGSGWFYDYDKQKWHRPVGDEPEIASAASSLNPLARYGEPKLADAVGSEHHSASYGRSPMMDELPAIKVENESRLEELRQREAEFIRTYDPTIPVVDRFEREASTPTVAEPAKPAPAVQGIRRRV